ncbi:MAG: excinuclease ABC subunit UvrC [Rhodospirillaceae bacterium]|nr:excinuclease ABC subunit UvrC [Rhodospirillaceae bacterium]
MNDSEISLDTAEAVPASALAGAALIKEHLPRLPQGPGVYRMLDKRGDALYVGKARSLAKRVANYVAVGKLQERLRRMVAETAALEIVSTHTEVEALLLESNLIKRLKPRYNVLLRDDKSFPYIHITPADAAAPLDSPHRWARIVKHRGARDEGGIYYGPFASAGAVNRTLNSLQRAFLLRSCTDGVFAARTRPCLLFQIKRCSAPCVGRIVPEDYALLIRQAEDFLSGRDPGIRERFAAEMEKASAALEFETAASYRDRIRALAHIAARQDINVNDIDEADVVAAHREAGQTCIQVFFFRGGQNWGNRAYFPRHDKAAEPGEVLGAFIGQFYDNKTPPRLVLLSEDVPDVELVAEALSIRAGRKVELAIPQRGDKKKLVDHALENARNALARRLAESASQRKLLEAVADAFRIESTPERIEIYDNSHIQGTNAVGAMVVSGPEGFVKSAYRKFNIKTAKPGLEGAITPGDDFGMMREVLTRRFKRAIEEDAERERGIWPDLVLIDGGAGQLSSAKAVLDDLGISDVALVAIAKGPDRNAGREIFHLPDGTERSFAPGDPVLFFLQRLRDEAHRFAIGAHRARRAASTLRSRLDEVPGIGASRKKALLLRFGSAKGVAEAGLADLETTPGISKVVAKKVYDFFHGEG